MIDWGWFWFGAFVIQGFVSIHAYTRYLHLKQDLELRVATLEKRIKDLNARSSALERRVRQ